MQQATIPVRAWAHPWQDGRPVPGMRRELGDQLLNIGLSEGLIVGRRPANPEPYFRHLEPQPADIGELDLDNIPTRALVLQPMLLPGEELALAATMNTSLGKLWRLYHDDRPIEHGLWTRLHPGDNVRVYTRADARQEWGIVLSALISNITSTTTSPTGRARWLPSTVPPSKEALADKLAKAIHDDMFSPVFDEWTEWGVAVAVLCALVVDHQTGSMPERMETAIRTAEQVWTDPETGQPYVSKYKGVSQFTNAIRVWSALNETYKRLAPSTAQAQYDFSGIFGIERPGGNNHDSKRIFAEQVRKSGIVTARELEWARRLLSERSPQ